MTYHVWEKQLLRYLKDQSSKDKKQILDYYREMYYDKVERGEDPNKVLWGFGDPKSCAERITMEQGGSESKSAPTPQNALSTPKRQKEEPTKKEKLEAYHTPRRKITVVGVIGWFFFSVLLLIPIGAAAISVVITFAAMVVSGYAMMLSGALFAVASPFGMIFGWSPALSLAGIGAGAAVFGAGAILAVVFTLLTKYSLIGLSKAFLLIVKGRE